MAGNEKPRELGTGGGLVIGGAIGALIASLFASRPAAAAPEADKLDYLAKLMENMVTMVGSILDAVQKIVKAQVPTAPGVVSSVQTPWLATEPQDIFKAAIRVAGTVFGNQMVDFRNSKRLSFKIESSLNQAVQIQVIGICDNPEKLATDIGPPAAIAANGNGSIGLAFDDWQPYIGVRIIVPVAPTGGILYIRAVQQE